MSSKDEKQSVDNKKQEVAKEKKPRKPVYLKDRKTSSGVTFGV